MTEILTCPNCQRQLQIPEQFLGQTVQCPECRHMFTATSTAVSSTPTATSPATAGTGAESKKPRYEDDDYDVPRRRRRFEDDDYDDEFDVRRGRPMRQHYDAHRGGVILALGLISLVGGLSICLPVLVGPVAWAMGSYDLREMREGRMDPSGESMTRTGQVLGIIATVLLILFAGFILLISVG
jgi:hypothetical protein